MEPIYAPYIPFTETPVIDPKDFHPNKLVNSRYRITGPRGSQKMLAKLLTHIRAVGPEAPRDREFPCVECETGEYQMTAGPSPSTGIMTFECDECSHEVSFP